MNKVFLTFVLFFSVAAVAELPVISLNDIQPIVEGCSTQVAQSNQRFEVKEPEQGIEVAGHPGMMLFRLGAGNSGSAYLVKVNGEFAGYIKAHKTLKRGWDRDTGWREIHKGADMHATDAFLFDFYRRDQQNGGDWGFEIPEVYNIQLKAGEASEIFPDGVGLYFKASFRGRDVWRISVDKEVPEIARDQITQDYARRMEQFHRRVNEVTGGFRDLHSEYAASNHLPFFYGEWKTPSGQTKRAYLKADGIIADTSSSRQILVDPN